MACNHLHVLALNVIIIKFMQGINSAAMSVAILIHTVNSYCKNQYLRFHVSDDHIGTVIQNTGL